MVEPELLVELEAVAQEAAGKAGAYVRSRFGGELKVERKSDSRGSLVTDADLESQKLIAEIIGARFPDHVILGEEDPPDEAPPANTFVARVTSDLAFGNTHTLRLEPEGAGPAVEIELAWRPYQVLGIAERGRWVVELPPQDLHVMAAAADEPRAAISQAQASV